MSENVALAHKLEALRPLLEDTAITDIRVQGELVAVKRIGSRRYAKVALSLNEKMQLRLARQIAGVMGEVLNEESPMQGSMLPDGSRVQLAIAPAHPVTLISIRKHALRIFPVEEYADQGALDAVRMNGHTLGPDQVIAVLRETIADEKNILISAGTNTGKTTFMRSLVNEVPKDHHLCFIQDADEMPGLPHPFVTKLMFKKNPKPGEVTAQDALEAALRVDPDHIYMQECRGAETLQFMSAINTGHDGSFGTIHANTPEEALRGLAERIWLNPSMAQLTFEQIQRNFGKSIHLVVQMGFNEGHRVVKEIYVHDGKH